MIEQQTRLKQPMELPNFLPSDRMIICPASIDSSSKPNNVLILLGMDGMYIGIGQSPRNPKNTHAVVVQVGIVIHDPHPSRAGVVKMLSYWLLLERARDGGIKC